MIDLIRVETSTDTRTHAAVPRGTPGAYFVGVPQLLEHRRFMLAALIPLLAFAPKSYEAYSPMCDIFVLTYMLCVTNVLMLLTSCVDSLNVHVTVLTTRKLRVFSFSLSRK